MVIPAGSIIVPKTWRDFGVFCQPAQAVRYATPIHGPRKSCIRDWAEHHPAHAVKEWTGHSDLSITDTYYLQVAKGEYERATRRRLLPVVTQPVTQLGENDAQSGASKNADDTHSVGATVNAQHRHS